MSRASLSVYGLSAGLLLLVSDGGSAYAGDALQVAFDCGSAIVCRDVTPKKFAQSNPDEKVVEATWRISARVDQGDIEDLKELLIEIHSPGQRARVMDFHPKT
ncbi:MAG: hypothetical protein N2C12_01500, partial [Planctomycetales bacterium]